MFRTYVKRGDRVRLVEYLITYSNLPGPRANLEVAQAFAQEAAVQAGAHQDKAWTLCLNFAGISPAHAPTNSPMEFLVFCGVLGLAALAGASPPLADRGLVKLRELADDPRWRVREAVAIGLQAMLRGQARKTLTRLKTWVSKENWLAMRAVAAALAEPARLDHDAPLASAALALHRQMTSRLRAAPDRSSESFRTLRQTLGYSLSVVAAAAPGPGFKFLRELAALRDPDLRWIVRENLKKQRLVRAGPQQTAALTRLVKPSRLSAGRPAASAAGRASRRG